MRAQFVIYFCLLIKFVFSKVEITVLSNPEVNMTVAEIVGFNGFPFQDHIVVTEDGYILALHRIPHGRHNTLKKEKQPILLQHGLLDSSFTWVNNGPNKSLGFILAEQGFDVWLGNSRGNKFSRMHTTLSPESNEFWDFTWDEMAKYDLPAVVDYILGITKKSKIGYVGHSQGCEIAFAKLTENGPLNSKIAAFAALAPAVYLGHLRSPIISQVNVAEEMNAAVQLMTHGEFFPNYDMMMKLFNFICLNSPNPSICFGNVTDVATIDSTNLDKYRMASYYAHTPAGTSSKNILHYAQSIKSNAFQMFDYGESGNIEHYQSPTPPQYKLDIHDVSIAIFYGALDLDTTPEDVNRTIEELGNAVVYTKFIQNYRHIDLTWGKDAHDDVFKFVISFFRTYL